jgi:hypothetical protein
MVGLIIHFCGVVTGFAFQSWGEFFAQKITGGDRLRIVNA